jgi:RNA polymerase sigma-32 factor
MQTFLMRAWSLVRVGSAHAQRRLFFRMLSEHSRLEQEMGAQLTDASSLADRLGVRPEDVSEMQGRLAARDFSLDTAVGEAGGASHLSLLPDESDDAEVVAARHERAAMVRKAMGAVWPTLTEREQRLLQRRYFESGGASLRQLAKTMQISSERVRQIEQRLLHKLRDELPRMASDPGRQAA